MIAAFERNRYHGEITKIAELLKAIDPEPNTEHCHLINRLFSLLFFAPLPILFRVHASHFVVHLRWCMFIRVNYWEAITRIERMRGNEGRR
jgi:hypothetical protein